MHDILCIERSRFFSTFFVPLGACDSKVFPAVLYAQDATTYINEERGDVMNMGMFLGQRLCVSDKATIPVEQAELQKTYCAGEVEELDWIPPTPSHE